MVRKLIELCPDSTSSRDCLDRTPLHIAAGTGSSVLVLDMLVKSYPEACLMQDADGRTSLHLACDNSCVLFEGGNTQREPPSFEVIHTLLSACMSAAVVEDKEGTNALEYAIFSEANIHVVKVLQKATQKEIRKKQQELRSRRALAA